MDDRVLLKKSAEKELERLPVKTHDRIVECLLLLREDPRPAGATKLQGREGYRIRVGNYRILYLVDDSGRNVEVVSIAHRRDVYRQDDDPAFFALSVSCIAGKSRY